MFGLSTKIEILYLQFVLISWLYHFKMYQLVETELCDTFEWGYTLNLSRTGLSLVFSVSECAKSLYFFGSYDIYLLAFYILTYVSQRIS